MATFKYFTTCNSQQVELSRVFHNSNSLFNPRTGWLQDSTRPFAFIGSCPNCGEQHIAQRMIEWKKNPSLHACNAKCMGGKVNGACECSCRGKNHGSSMFSDAGAFRAAA